MVGVAPIGSVETGLSVAQVLPKSPRPVLQTPSEARTVVSGAALSLIQQALQPSPVQSTGLDVKA